MGKVAILARVQENGAYPFYDPVWKNHKLIGGAVLKNGIETAYPNITYYFRFHDPSIGKQVTQNVGRNAADVLAQFVALCGKLDNPQEPVSVLQIAPSAARTTIQEAIDKYLDDLRLAKYPPKSVSGKQRDLRAFTQLFPRKMYLDEFGREEFLRFRANLEAQDYAAKTVDNMLVCLKTFWNEANHDVKLSAQDWPIVEDNDPEPYNDDEMRAMFKHANPMQTLLFRTLVSTGFRDMEIAHLRREDVDYVRRVAIIQAKRCGCVDCVKEREGWWRPKITKKTKKGGGRREVPISRQLIEDLLKVSKLGPGGELFPSPTGKVWGKILRDAVQEVAKNAGVANPKTHRFRDTFITNKLRDGVDIRTVQVWAGHASIEQTMQYSDWLKNESKAAREAAEKEDSRYADAAD